MGRFTNLVDTLEGIESFKARYRIPPRFPLGIIAEGSGML